MRLASETYDLFEDAVAVHQMDECDENDERHQMRHDHVAQPFPAAGAIDHGGFKRVHVHGLKTSVENDKGKGRHVPDPVEIHQDLDRPGLREHRYVLA